MGYKQKKHKQQGNILFLVPAITILFLSITYHSEIQEVVAENEVQEKETQHERHSEIKALNHEQILQLTDQFMNLILQDVDEAYQVKNYHTKNELLDAFEEIAAREVAKPYVDFYFHEEQGSMYILPTEAPSWFVEENAYDMIQVADNKVKLIQENYIELYGSYTIEIEFTFEGKWKITEIKHVY
jgi:small nuclear ribonucleoprotein (snRNP)-like protein